MAEKYDFSNPNDMKALSALILARKPNTPVSVGYSTTLEGNRVDMGLLWLDPKPEDSRFTIRATEADDNEDVFERLDDLCDAVCDALTAANNELPHRPLGRGNVIYRRRS